MPKLYAVEFTEPNTGDSFVKIGWTKEYDVMERFSAKTSMSYGQDPEQYSKWNIKVLASAYSTSFPQVKEAEEALKKKYPKNFWLKEKISGVTEIVKLDPESRDCLIQDVLSYRESWYKQRRGNQNVVTKRKV